MCWPTQSHRYELSQESKISLKSKSYNENYMKIFRIPVSAILIHWKLQFDANVLQYEGTQVTVENKMPVRCYALKMNKSNNLEWEEKVLKITNKYDTCII